VSTQVFVNCDGGVNHSHPGVKGWHGPWVQHSDTKLHTTHRAAQPTNLADLTPEQAAQYKDALVNKTNYDKILWAPAKNARVAAGKKVRGPGAGKNERVYQGLTAEELQELGDPIGFARA
jgi:hypothetical protein